MTVQWLVVMLLFPFLTSGHSALIAVPIVLAAAMAWGFLERVTVIDNRNPRYCRSCRYDLSGTLDAGITMCPECGTPAAAGGTSGSQEPQDRDRGSRTKR